jgi:calcineurin-like phosphoesterase family protein
MNNYWITSDLHLGHDAVFEFEPWRTSFEKMLKPFKHIPPDDIIINLGDIGFYNHEYWITEYVKCNKAKKVLTLGNHDRHSYNWFYKYGFDFVCERFSLNIYGHKILFSHVPVEVPEGCINIFGHLHTINPMNKLDELYPFYSPETHICFETKDNCRPVTLKNMLKGR